MVRDDTQMLYPGMSMQPHVQAADPPSVWRAARRSSQACHCRLKDKGRVFRETFLGKLGLLLRGTVAAPPERFGETIEDERIRGGACSHTAAGCGSCFAWCMCAVHMGFSAWWKHAAGHLGQAHRAHRSHPQISQVQQCLAIE